MNCTSPANYFHALRRQMRRDFRKPLVVLTPKSLLRHKLAVSKLEEFGPGTSFHRILSEPFETGRPTIRSAGSSSAPARSITTCLQEREARGIKDVAIVRLEQLYPFPRTSLTRELSRYKNADVVWCQEEPRNMGAWAFIDRRLEDCIVAAQIKASRPAYAGRVEAASPATGMLKRHNREQAQLVDDALTVK